MTDDLLTFAAGLARGEVAFGTVSLGELSRDEVQRMFDRGGVGEVTQPGHLRVTIDDGNLTVMGWYPRVEDFGTVERKPGAEVLAFTPHEAVKP